MIRTIIRIFLVILVFLGILWVGGSSWSDFKSSTDMKSVQTVYEPIINKVDVDVPELDDGSTISDDLFTTEATTEVAKNDTTTETTEDNGIGIIDFKQETDSLIEETDDNTSTTSETTEPVINIDTTTEELNGEIVADNDDTEETITTETTTEVKVSKSAGNEKVSASLNTILSLDNKSIDLSNCTTVSLLDFLAINWSNNVSVSILHKDDATTENTTTSSTTTSSNPKNELGISVDDFNGTPYVEINNNVPYFTKEDYTTKSFEKYADLDDLGRCGVAYACIGKDIMPTEKRGSIGSIKPSGWHTSNYNEYPGLIDGNYLYNRCHLIAYMLAGENANKKNLITGTRYLNIDGMLTYEDKVHDYMVENEKNHVLYRVTPIFNGDNLVADGVLMEAYSVEDNGKLQFCVFCYNVQPNVVIDYATGDNHISDSYGTTTEDTSWEDNPNWYSYVLNENSKKIHTPDCENGKKINSTNRTETNRSYDELIKAGYKPCGVCHPEELE